MTDHYLLPEQLRPGVFVILDLPWFKHSFTLNSFKIRNAEQVGELRALKLARYRYDPQRSDAGVATPASGAAHATVAKAEEPPPPPKEADLALKAKRERTAAWRDQVANVERGFTKAAALMKGLNKNLLAQPAATLEELGALVGQMVTAFLESPDVTLHVMGDKVGGEEVYFHSLNVTILAMMLARDLGFTPEVTRELGVGTMVHDIGLMDIPDRVLRKSPDEYNSAERNLRAQHVEYGVTMGRKIGLSSQALAVVAQHHEMADGSGYPKGSLAEAMTPAARLVAVVNYYDNLCNPVDIHKALTPHEALSLMFAKQRSKFDAKVLQLMIRCLGIYPPGSVVQLNNDVLAVVTSVNPKKPLRPCVLIYDPGVPKDEAIMLDLEQETEINIAKAVRPSLLAPHVAAYLNPRKRVTYFFDGGKNAAKNEG